MTDQAGQPRTLFGHPLGLYVLFFTEMWERFSFYGMKTLMVLYLVNQLYWSQERAAGLLGWYAFLAYGLPVFGGLIADRWLGARRSVIVGAMLLSAGHLCMAIETMPFFYTALGLIIVGVGLLKPNVSTQVGSLYPPGDPRRDGAFTIFYMGINLGALMGPLLCSWLQVTRGWSYGFGAAGVGMILGLIVYVLGQKVLVEHKQDVPTTEEQKERAAHPAHPPHVVRDRIIVLLVVFAFIIIFWTAFEQSYVAMLLWADKHSNLRLMTTEVIPVSLDGTATDATQEDAGFVESISKWFRNPTMTSGQTQSFNPFFIITLAPVLAFLWIWLDRRKLQPSTPTKMVLGLLGVALAYGVMWPAAYRENGTSSAPLASLPAGIHADDEGYVYVEKEEGGKTDRAYFNAHRMRYDRQSGTLTTAGVLTDLDRLNLLSETAPVEFRETIEQLVSQSEARASQAKIGEEWELTASLPSAPSHFKVAGDEAEKLTVWDSDSDAITMRGKINERAKAELLAAGGDPVFMQAVDVLYVDSSLCKVSVWWLVAFYLVLTLGELCLSPVGLSLVTKLAPTQHVGLFMGGWFLATAIAEKLAQMFGAYWGKMPPGNYFMIFVVMCGVGALLMALLIRPLKRMMHGVQ